MKFNFEFNHNINYKIKGLNIEKSLNNLTKNKIKLKNIKKNEQNEVEFSSFYKNNSKILNYLEKKNIKIINKQDYGMVFSLKKLLKRYALIASVFFSFIAIFFSQNFILKIEVYGNKHLSTTEIQSCIKNLGVGAFTSKNSFSTTDLENEILKELPSVSMVSVITKGTSLIVNIQEKVINEEEHNLGNFKPLTASMSGRITEIKLIQGTLKVKVGDIVKKGDILVEPHIIDSFGNIKEVMAKAEIFAEVWLEGRSTHYDSCYKTIKTGKKVEKQDIYFLNQPIYLDKADFDYLEYETSFKQTYLSYSLLPLVLKKTIVEETQTILEEIPFGTVRKQKVEEAKNVALSKAQNKSVINEYHTINSNNGVTIVSYVLVAIENISLQ